MAVTITYKNQPLTRETPDPPARGNRGKGFDAEVRYYAEEIRRRMENGQRTIRKLVDALNDDGITNAYVRPWSLSGMQRMLKRGDELGLGIRASRPGEIKRQYRHRARTPARFSDRALAIMAAIEGS